jgi:hypothetical protein
MKILHLSPLLVLVVIFLSPSPARAQGAELLQSIRQGGGWVEIPIADGSGVLRTDAVPTLGLTVTGCVNIWPGHSGRWSLEATDPMNGGSLDATVTPGEGVPFTYRTGLRSSLDVRVRWSEPRDTTLLLWVGLDSRASAGRDSCTPVYATGATGGD